MTTCDETVCLGNVLFDVLLRVTDGLDLLSLFVRDLHPELFLEAHDQLDEVERVRVQVVDERRLRLHVCLVDAELLDDDRLEAFADVCLRQSPPPYVFAISGPPGRDGGASVTSTAKCVNPVPALKNRREPRLVIEVR